MRNDKDYIATLECQLAKANYETQQLTHELALLQHQYAELYKENHEIVCAINPLTDALNKYVKQQKPSWFRRLWKRKK